MKLVTLLLSLLLLLGCSVQKPPMCSLQYAHWSDISISDRYPDLALICNADGRLVGEIKTYSKTWFANAHVRYPVTELNNEFVDENSAKTAVELYVDFNAACQRTTR